MSNIRKCISVYLFLFKRPIPIFHPIAIFLNQLIKQDSIVRVNKDTWNIWKCWVYISIYLFSFDKKEPIQFLIL